MLPLIDEVHGAAVDLTNRDVEAALADDDAEHYRR